MRRFSRLLSRSASTPVDAKVAVPVVQFTAAQLNVNASVPASLPPLKYSTAQRPTIHPPHAVAPAVRPPLDVTARGQSARLHASSASTHASSASTHASSASTHASSASTHAYHTHKNSSPPPALRLLQRMQAASTARGALHVCSSTMQLLAAGSA